jgi:hypothetical protein
MDPLLFHTKAVTNTFVKILPIGLYFGTVIMGVLFTDIRAFMLFIGYLFNDFISLGFRQLFQTVDLPNCAIVESNKSFYTLPSSHTQTMAFTLAFFMTDMYVKNNFNPINFILLTTLLFVTMWSRFNVGCESISDTVFATLIGLMIGTLFYKVIDTWNLSSSSNETTQKSDTIEIAPKVEIYQRA